MFDAEREPSIDIVRQAVPEFEPTFRAAVSDERAHGDPLSAFEAMWEFGRWLGEQTDEGVLRRAMDAIERLLTHPTSNLASDLAIDFLESLPGESRLLPYFGPESREWWTRWGATPWEDRSTAATIGDYVTAVPVARADTGELTFLSVSVVEDVVRLSVGAAGEPRTEVVFSPHVLGMLRAALDDAGDRLGGSSGEGSES